MHKVTYHLWRLASIIIEMLHNQVSCDYLHCIEALTKKCQNIEEQFPHLISDILTVCIKAFQTEHPDEWMTLLVYEVQYSHIMRVKATNPASVFPLDIIPGIKQQFHLIIKRISTLHPQKQGFVFTGQHYAMVAQHVIQNHLNSFHSRSVSANRFFYFSY